MLRFSLLLLLFSRSQPTALAAAEEQQQRRRRTRHLRRAQASNPPCDDLFTLGNFQALAPDALPPYTYDGLCAAILSWNTDNPTEQIFTSGTELQQRHELAAFIGHTLHESGDYVYPRELSQCGTTVTDGGGVLYCRPNGYNPSGSNPEYTAYCESALTNLTDPDGCACSPVPESPGLGYEANKMFFGRGALQLSWNYNYIDAATALAEDTLCDNPELIATNETMTWGTAISFWMQNAGNGGTCHDAIVSLNDFGASLNTINGGLECGAQSSANAASIISRLDDYCRAVDELGAGSLLSFDGCGELETRYNECLAQGSCPNCVGIPTTAQPTGNPTTPVTSPPTANPSKAPTGSPASPTASPSKAPSSSPSPPIPSTSPSKPPTTAPSISPVIPPTTSPMASPPTANPSKAPTGSPASPTASPSKAPSSSPSPPIPSTSPSKPPTTAPSISPVIPPTTSPMASPPTANPSKAPTGSPASPTASPSKAPSSSPSPPIPSTSPSKPPTTAPSISPVIPPTTSPMASPPTANPSKAPTGSPASPTASPSKAPSSSPSPPIPSTSPSKPPTTAPSISPVIPPTTSPMASPPTANPSKAPSASPATTSPTQSPVVPPTVSPIPPIPSTSPSKLPTSAPSSSPTSPQPTGSPSRAPSLAPAPCLYYSNGTTCVNDCQEWEAADIYNSTEACCNAKHKNWNLFECLGITASPSKAPTSSPVGPSQSPTPEPTRSPSVCPFYSNGTTCVNDCQEWEAADIYNSTEACCNAKHKNWNLFECLGITASPSKAPTSSPVGPSQSPTPEPTRSPSVCPFYSNGTTCVNDCQEWEAADIYNSTEACCNAKHKNWNLFECLGITASPSKAPTSSPVGPSQSPTPEPTRSPSVCPFYSNGTTCVNDCQEWEAADIYNSTEACCNAKHKNWNLFECLGITASPSKAPTSSPVGPSQSPTPEPTRSPSVCPFYSNGTTCVNDCQEWEAADIYNSTEACCNAKHKNWNLFECLGITASPSKAPTSSPVGPSQSPTPEPTRSPSVCPFYSNGTTCVNDCQEWEAADIYNSTEACCNAKHKNWNLFECLGITASPSKAPTSSPVGPSQSPTPEPTRSPSVCPFYTNGSTCVNDCNEAGATYDNLKDCCDVHHLWNYDECLGITASPSKAPTTSPSGPSKSPTPAPSRSPGSCLFYNDGVSSCISDCNEGGDWVPTFDTLEDCCLFHWNWNNFGDDYYECMGITRSPSKVPTEAPASPSISPTLEPTRSPLPCPFYTNGRTCVNDCNEAGATYDNLKDCCDVHHKWNYDECLGITASPSKAPTTSPSGPSKSPTPAPSRSPGSCLFYNDGVSSCISDCNEGWVPTFDTLELCCQNHWNWNDFGEDYLRCMGITRSPSKVPTRSPIGPSVSPTPEPSRSPGSCLFYSDGVSSCISDCNEGWVPTFDTLELCCQNHWNWNDFGEDYLRCMGITRSPSKVPTRSPIGPSVSPTPEPSRSPGSCLFYSDGVSSCISDCNEGWVPTFDTLELCCQNHWNWNDFGEDYLRCMGITRSPSKVPTRSPIGPSVSPTPEPSRSPGSCLFYSDGVSSCISDCNEGWVPTFDTLELCCQNHWNWNDFGEDYLKCMGITRSPSKVPTRSPIGPSMSPTAGPSNAPAPCVFYSDSTSTCRNDCLNSEWVAVFDTKDECCSTNWNWDPPRDYNICMGITQSPSRAPTRSPFGPTDSPTSSPSKAPAPCVFYSDSTSTCLNDCLNSEWVTPFDTKDECCSTNWNWDPPRDYNICMGITQSPSRAPTRSPFGPTDSPTSSPSKAPAPCVFYSDSKSTCLNDCLNSEWVAPFDTKHDCCSTNWNWDPPRDYNECMGNVTESPSASPTKGPTNSPQQSSNIALEYSQTGASLTCQFYNNWAGTCSNNCNEPGPPLPPLYETLEACCAAQYTWSTEVYEACILTSSYPPTISPTQSTVQTGSFYIDWDNLKCVQNCDTSLGAPCGGINNEFWVEMHDDVQQCCRKHLSYMCSNPNIPCEACTDADISAWTKSPSSFGSIYYIDWDLEKCVENCSSGDPHCKGPPKSYQQTHSNLATCCMTHLDFKCPDAVYPCSGCTDVPFI